MSAIFYAEDMGISLDVASRLSAFMQLAESSKAVESAAPWSKHGKTRAYIELWSQNSLFPVSDIEKCFYDADDDDIYIVQYRYGWRDKTPLSKVITFGRSSFSGSKTRKALEDLAEAFYG